MNDKVKGLVLGLTLGVMLTGSIAYASGTQIEVYFKNIKYMFDGNEKNPTSEQGEGFIYNGTTYVPLRFVSEALGKEVQWDNDTDTAWIGKKVDLKAIVAKYEGGQVTRGTLNKYITFNALLNPDNAQYENDAGYQAYMVKQMLGQQILFDRMNEDLKKSTAVTVDAQLVELNKFLGSSGQDVNAVLAKNGLTVADVRHFVEIIIGSQNWTNSQATDERLKDLYDQEINGNLVKASVRHILINKNDDKDIPRTKEVIDQKLKEIQDKLKNGDDFAALAKQYSEDPGSKDNGGLYADTVVSNWVESFKKAAITLEINKVSDPVESEFGYHIIRVESRTPSTATFDSLKDGLKKKLVNDLAKQFNEIELPKLIQTSDLTNP